VAAAHSVRLLTLSLLKTQLDAEGAKILAAVPWPLLNYFKLKQNHIGFEGASALAKASMPSLRLLLLAYNDLGKQAGEALSAANWHPSLKLELSE
jgi:hypothetical protein